MTRVLLGIDIGTSGAKVVATDLEGRRVADATVRYPIATAGAGAEQDALAWWAAVTEACARVVPPLGVVAVAVTSQAPTLVPIDTDGIPVGPALTWLDRRAMDEARRVAELAPGSRNGADPFFGTAKLLWLDKHRPEVFARTDAVVAANGFIVRQLTGECVLDVTTASLMQGFDETTGAFDAALVAAEPSLSLLPRIAAATAIVGHISAEASAATGIAVGTPVAAGAIDAVGSAIEAGALMPGDPVVDMTGFSSVMIASMAPGTAVPGFIHSRHGFEGTDLLIAAQTTAGATIDWVNSLDQSRDLRDDDAILRRERPGRLTMITSLAGERTPSWNPSARGIVDGIDLATDGTDLMLAAMEGNAIALANDIQLLQERGVGVDRVISTGGGASSRAWLQIKADVLGIPVVRPDSGHGAAQGAAALAGLAVGVYESVDTLRGLAVETLSVFEPDAAVTSAYRDVATRYSRLSALNTERR